MIIIICSLYLMCLFFLLEFKILYPFFLAILLWCIPIWFPLWLSCLGFLSFLYLKVILFIKFGKFGIDIISSNIFLVPMFWCSNYANFKSLNIGLNINEALWIFSVIFLCSFWIVITAFKITDFFLPQDLTCL